MEYSVGMKIKIKEESELGELFIKHKYADGGEFYHLIHEDTLKRGVAFGKEMFCYCGKVANIVEIYHGIPGMYRLDIDNGRYYWIEAWLKPAVQHINIMD
jgi:hypothetical protein